MGARMHLGRHADGLHGKAQALGGTPNATSTTPTV